MENENTVLPHHHRGERIKSDDSHLRLRNWLNIIFMVGAVAGVAVYFLSDTTVGTIIILIAVVFKIIESALRIKF